jgi:hypothetical protein
VSTESAVIGGCSLLVGLVCILIVGYDIFRYPATPKEMGEAEVEIAGTGHFRGDVGSYQGETHTIEGRAPFSVSFPYKEADYVFADIERDSGDAVKMLILDEHGESGKGSTCKVIESGKESTCKVVGKGKGSTFLIWESPRRNP